MPTTLKLIYLRATPLARCYEKAGGRTQWVPRRVCPRVLKQGDEPGALHEVTIEDWWLEKNPFDRPDTDQAQLL